MTDQQRPPSRIPEFASIEEEAAFWDTHDPSDYRDEFRPIEIRVSPNLAPTHTVRLDASDHEEVRRFPRS